MKKIMIVVLLAVFMLSFGRLALSQEKFPTRPITVILHSAPGGGSTLNAQSVQHQFEKTIGASMMIVNKPGGGGTIAWNFVANAPPDGYTVLGGVNPSLIMSRYINQAGVSYDRFEPILMTVRVPAGIVVPADSPWKTLKEFTDYARANPGKVQMGNSGHATMFHVGNVGLEMALDLKFTHIPYKGSGPVVTALLGGHVDAGLVELSTLIPLVEAKRLRILAISSAQRSSVLPDVPTFKEFGFDLDVGSWYGYMVPKKTPQDRIRLLHNAFKAGVDSEEFKTTWRRGGVFWATWVLKNLPRF